MREECTIRLLGLWVRVVCKSWSYLFCGFLFFLSELRRAGVERKGSTMAARMVSIYDYYAGKRLIKVLLTMYTQEEGISKLTSFWLPTTAVSPAVSIRSIAPVTLDTLNFQRQSSTHFT